MNLRVALSHYSPDPLYVEIGPLIFIWKGGAYIDIWVRDPETMDVKITDACINVWDYEKDEAIIPFSPEALIDTVTKWIGEAA